jgi:hypothetical protein
LPSRIQITVRTTPGMLGEKGVDCGGDLLGASKYHEVPGVRNDDFAVGLKRGAELGAIAGPGAAVRSVRTLTVTRACTRSG